MKVIAIESSRKEPSIGGDLRELLGIQDGGLIYLQSATQTISGPVNKVNLSTARLAEWCVAKKHAAGFVFLPTDTLAQLGVSTGGTINVSKHMPSNTPAIAEAAADETPPETKAGKILRCVELLAVGNKFTVPDVITMVKSAYDETVDADRVRAVLNACDFVLVTRAEVGRGNVYEKTN